jgi:23S rRNA pseudouridine955/2504/2580 synthase
MIFALNEQAEKELLVGFKKRNFIKIYNAHVVGVPKKQQAILTAYLIKDKENSKVFITKNPDKGSKVVTSYNTLKRGEHTSLVEVELLTGKTHQIRAHLAFYGHFIIGDGKYGQSAVNNRLGVTKQQLTSYKLTLRFDKDSVLSYLDKKTFTLDKTIQVY